LTEHAEGIRKHKILPAWYSFISQNSIDILPTFALPMAKKELYLKLAEKGWTKEEIYPLGGAGLSRRSQGNLDVLPGGRARFPIR